MLGAIVSVQVGAAVASGLVREVGPAVTVGIRLAVAALVMLLLARPSVRGRSRRDWLVVVALGVCLAAMNVCFYGALARLPLGVATTIDFLGPLGLAAALSRRPAHLVAVLLAFVGVVALPLAGLTSRFLMRDLVAPLLNVMSESYAVPLPLTVAVNVTAAPCSIGSAAIICNREFESGASVARR